LIDDAKAQGLQAIYKAGRAEALNALAAECQGIALEIIKVRLRRRGLQFQRSAMEDLAHEASTRLISRYLTTPGYIVRRFPRVLRDDVTNVMTDGGHQDRPKATAMRETVEADDTLPAECREAKDDVRDFARDLESEHPRGAEILVDIYRATSFRAAMLKLAEYVDKRWLYDRAVKLRTVYRMTRRRR
jgi:hypothetical protein